MLLNVWQQHRYKLILSTHLMDQCFAWELCSYRRACQNSNANIPITFAVTPFLSPSSPHFHQHLPVSLSYRESFSWWCLNAVFRLLYCYCCRLLIRIRKEKASYSRQELQQQYNGIRNLVLVAAITAMSVRQLCWVLTIAESMKAVGEETNTARTWPSGLWEWL